MSRVVAARRLLDLQHLCSEVAQHHRAKRPSQDPRQIEDADSAKGGRVRRFPKHYNCASATEPAEPCVCWNPTWIRWPATLSRGIPAAPVLSVRTSADRRVRDVGTQI